MRKLVAWAAAAGLALTLSACDEKMGFAPAGQTPTTDSATGVSGQEASGGDAPLLAEEVSVPDAKQDHEGDAPLLAEVESVPGVEEHFPNLTQYFEVPLAADWRAGLTCGQALSDPTGKLLREHTGRIVKETGLNGDDVFEQVRGYCATVGQGSDDVSLALFLANGYALDPHGQVPITPDNVAQVGCRSFIDLPAAEKDGLFAMLRPAYGSEAEFAEYRSHAEDMCSVFPTNGILIGLLTPKEPGVDPGTQIMQRFPQLEPYFKYPVPANWRAGLTCQQVLADETGTVLWDAAPKLASQLDYTPQSIADAIKGYCHVLGQPGDDVSLAVHLSLSYSLWPQSAAEVTQSNVGQVGCETFSKFTAAERDGLFALLRPTFASEDEARGFRVQVEELCAAYPTNAILLGLLR
ncbi:hypothetical protein [Buchananella hordeovulneris]|uniref:Septum formation-related domain-containing protein n=1 Tax=Buchananella hordeovulneris TaxID=52770 RepID=A0A1Q5PTF8_9ACTO|nr:hypothetical protein [Buchananella hordeovulneris]OKL50858.1 hypothetical protein BSZ40_10520 [Buchananella hordeovulneris]